MNKGHINSESSIVNKFNEYKEFIKDKHVEFVIKKTERITYGVYMLSNFIPLTEALNGDLKKTSHALLRLVSRFPQTTGIKMGQIDLVHGQLQYLSSLLSLAFISGYLSESNIEMIKNEINYLHKHVEELSTKSASDTGHMHIKTDLFVVGQHKNPKTKPDQKEIIKDTSTVQVAPIKKVSFIKDTPKPVTRPVAREQEESKEDREEKVLHVIRDKGVVSIKDITSVIFEVSEKTIQRTLQALIDKGQIKKEGERRWAKYRLV
jgi:hypothetical protein